MPISTEDAQKVEDHIRRIFSADDSAGRAEAIRRLFVEVLDFHGAARQVPLAGAATGVALPDTAYLLAQLDGVQVLYIALDTLETDKVRKSEASAAAELIAEQLGADLLLVFTNTSANQMHLISPDLEGARPSLRRMIVERDLPRRTAVGQLAGIYSKADNRPVRTAIEDAFDVGPVTKQFFAEYRRIFEAAKERVSGFESDEDRHLFVQTLFNRLMFVHFLSRKGWLTFGQGEGRADYLKTLWEDYKGDQTESNFHENRLRLLFFSGLNNSQSSDLTNEAAFGGSYLHSRIGPVPFLNGGLFEETPLDRHPDVTVPDEAIEPLLRQLFDKFNFTVMESTPLDIEVAVDPEMLGKVFEELVTGRHESGSYYTPRPVVSFMCREALKGYLEGATGLDAETIARFVDERNASGIPLAEARAAGEALDEVTVVDPACGSGAYLLGMMQELVELHTTLYNAGVDSKSIYELKLHIIERNLHGVDLDGFAVNIAMLRLWLSLAIDYEGERPEPLPNLDFKIVRGDSLLGPDPSALSFNRVHIEKSGLERLKGEYLRSFDGFEKTRLRDEIANAREQVRADLGGSAVAEGVVDWRVEFADVFAARGGFDIAIANPPYERQEQISASKQNLKLLYSDVYAGRADYLVYFYNRAVQSLRDGGTLAFISSNKYMRAGYGKGLRTYLSSRLTLSQVVDFADLPVFTATAYPSIVVGRKGHPKEDDRLRVADLGVPIRRGVAAKDLPVTTETVNRVIDGLPALLDAHAVNDYPRTMLGEDGWVLEDMALVRLFERLMNTGTPLGEFVEGRIYMGVKTGLNEAFVIDQAKRDEIVGADPRSADLIKPWLRGRDIRRWRAEWAGKHIIFTSRGVDISQYPAVEEHLGLFRTALERRATAHLHPWYQLQQPQEGIYCEFEHPKIIFNRFISSPTFAFDTSGIYHNNACDFAVTPTPSLAAIVNSKVGWWLLGHLCTMLQNGYFQVFTQFLERLPVPALTEAFDQRLTELVLQATAGDVTPALESEIDDLVSEAFNLTDSERTLIREWFERRSLSG